MLAQACRGLFRATHIHGHINQSRRCRRLHDYKLAAMATQAGSSPRYGMFSCSGSASIVEVLGHSGLDWICIDTQHGAIGYDQLATLLRAAASSRVETIVRVGGPQDQYGIQQALDLGASAVMVPLINSAAQAQEAVSCCLFPPDGKRSVVYPVRAGYERKGMGIPALAAYLQDANKEVEVWLQVESKECMDDLDAVLSTPGITCAFLGPADMSVSLGLHQKYDYDLAAALSSAEMQQVYNTVLQACQRHGVSPGVFCLGAARAKELATMGYHMIGYDVDTNAVISYTQASMAQLRP